MGEGSVPVPEGRSENSPGRSVAEPWVHTWKQARPRGPVRGPATSGVELVRPYGADWLSFNDPGFRYAPPWAILVASLRETGTAAVPILITCSCSSVTNFVKAAISEEGGGL